MPISIYEDDFMDTVENIEGDSSTYSASSCHQVGNDPFDPIPLLQEACDDSECDSSVTLCSDYDNLNELLFTYGK